MKRSTVKAGLVAFRSIESDILLKREFYRETGDSKYLDESEDLHRVKQEILEAINSLPDTERNVLYYRFVKGLIWPIIASKCLYSERQVKNYSYTGLDRLGKLFDRNDKITAFCIKAEMQ